jgi:hypothetical protein
MSTKERLRANNTCEALSTIYHSLSARARVVKWQTRTFEGRMPQGMGVQVPPRAFLPLPCTFTLPSRNNLSHFAVARIADKLAIRNRCKKSPAPTHSDSATIDRVLEIEFATGAIHRRLASPCCDHASLFRIWISKIHTKSHVRRLPKKIVGRNRLCYDASCEALAGLLSEGLVQRGRIVAVYRQKESIL